MRKPYTALVPTVVTARMQIVRTCAAVIRIQIEVVNERITTRASARFVRQFSRGAEAT